MIEIRKAKEKEYQDVEQFLKDQGFEFLPELVTYIVDCNTKIIGAAQLKVEKDKAEIISIVVDESFRGNKIGDGLLKMLINHCYNNNIPFIKVKTNNADWFFSKVGFIKMDEFLVLDVQAFYSNLRCHNE